MFFKHISLLVRDREKKVQVGSEQDLLGRNRGVGNTRHRRALATKNTYFKANFELELLILL